AAAASGTMNGSTESSVDRSGRAYHRVEMFLGHFGLGLAAKKAAPTVSLGALFAAAQFADLLWPTLVLLGVEQVRVQPGITAVTPLDFVRYPYSHSLLMLCVWGVAFGGVYVALRGARAKAAVVLALLVVSHWVL